MTRTLLIATGTALLILAEAVGEQDLLTARDIVGMNHPPANQRISYGPHALQFGELRLPEGEGPHPLAVIVHGGCWLAEFDLAHLGSLAAALTDAGFAAWSIEYRRVGDDGGGWPNTFLDVGAGVDHVRSLAQQHRLDLARAIVVGHSAGGHLALWAAARAALPAGSQLWVQDPMHFGGVLGLAAAGDIEMVHSQGACGNVIDKLMGGSPGSVPQRYAQASSSRLVPVSLPQILIDGALDRWASVSASYYEAARAAGASVSRRVVPGAGHFELIVPEGPAWDAVRAAALELIQ